MGSLWQTRGCSAGAGVQPDVCACVWPPRCVRVCACTGGAGSSGHPPPAPPATAATPVPAPARGTGDAARAGGGSMASPRAAELRSPGEAAAEAGPVGAIPGGPGAGPGLALALGCALSGAALVVLAGAIPRAARPDPTVPARQMERLEERAARLRARLDRCTVAGLALLALGGLLLAALLLAAAAARRRARAARRTGGTYGSVRLRLRRVSAEGTRALLESQLSPPAQPPEGPGS
ncbi:transmembrane protein 74B [Dryobates pubescens]|uniref:transmembrane protein 74B n=1 Tax=Dryobates pubescens TaxID=118200 RepID=UPI0023B8C2FF|nr:transmembrane protein 74B [Dryobates pubescens]